ncbi:TetR/AcrR family transcriptional regulator [Actinocorallia aurantiaca]
MREPSSPDEQEQVMLLAGRLFSQIGYDATTIQMISDAAGVPVDSVLAIGTKQQIYRAVLDSLWEKENRFLEELASRVPPGPEGLHILADAFLDFCLENPELPSLWMHRWLADAADIRDLEARYAVPVMSAMADVVRGLGNPDVDPVLAAHGAVWLAYGYAHTGLQFGYARSPDANAPENVRRFKAYFHSLIDCLF